MSAGPWTIEIPWIPMAMNVRERAHWGTRKTELKTLRTELGWLAIEQKIPKAHKGNKRRVEIVIVKRRGARPDDPGNLPSRAKSILDALVHNQTLYDDDNEHLELLVRECEAQENRPRTLITISTVERAT